jgi:hypothetical protein
MQHIMKESFKKKLQEGPIRSIGGKFSEKAT